VDPRALFVDFLPPGEFALLEPVKFLILGTRQPQLRWRERSICEEAMFFLDFWFEGSNGAGSKPALVQPRFL